MAPMPQLTEQSLQTLQSSHMQSTGQPGSVGQAIVSVSAPVHSLGKATTSYLPSRWLK